MNVRTSLASIILLLSSGPLNAQWSGNLNADGAYNFKQSNRENLSFGLKYNARKFYVGVDLGGSHNYTPSAQITEILDAKKEGSEYYKEEDKNLYPRNWNIKGSVISGYRFDEMNTLDLSIGYGYKGKTDYPILETYRFTGADRRRAEGVQRDSTDNFCQIYDLKVSYDHKFHSRPSAILAVTISGIGSYAVENNTRITSGDFYTNNKYYRTNSSINDLDSKLTVLYGDLFKFDKSKLKLDAGVDVSTDTDIDIYRASTNVGGQWRDSTRYKQSYYYYAHTVEPYANLKYSVGKFDFIIREKVQFFNHCILDKLDEKKDNPVFLFDITDWQNMLGAGLTYKISDNHSLQIDYGRSIARPDYKKLCPTMMIGGSEGEYFIGNPQLLPEITDKIGFVYNYHHRIFVTSLSLSYTDKENTAEKVLETSVDRDALDPMVKTLYTWVNTKSQQTFGSRLNMTMTSSDIVAQIWAGFNYDIYKTKSDITKKDYNYELGTSVVASLNESVKLSTQLVYVSARASAYNEKGENVLANLRVSKVFSEKLELYLEGRDLVDKDKYEETWNEAFTYYKCVTTLPMNRALVLGLKFSF